MQNFKPIHKFSVEVSGNFACFTDPVSKVERSSYPAPTAGALEYMMERIYIHPNVRYCINKVSILNPLKFYGIYMNERNYLGDVNLSTGEVNTPDADSPFQRMTTYLRDVDYVVDFTMYYDKDYYRRNNLPRFLEWPLSFKTV